MPSNPAQNTGIRLREPFFTQLTEQAEARSLTRAKFGAELLQGVLEQVEEGGAQPSDSAMLDKLDSLERNVRRLEDSIGLTLRAVLGTLLEGEEKAKAKVELDRLMPRTDTPDAD